MTYYQRTDDKYYCFYINHCMMDVFSGIMSWFNTSYYNAFKHKILGGYDKAIREIKNHYNNNEQGQTVALPAISLNPFGDISVDPKFAHLWRVPSIGTNLHRLYLDPIYEDEDFGFTVVANRFIGNFEVIIYCESAYEYLDFFTQTLMWFHGGFNRRVRPGLITTNCIIPDEVVTQSYGDGPYDWSKAGVTKHFIKSMNEDYYLYPMTLGPQIWLTSVTNASTVYGEDDLSSYKLQLSIEYDVDLPTHIIVKTTKHIEHLNMHISTVDPVYVPKISVTENKNNSVVYVNDPYMKDRPEDALGDPRYFKVLKQEEYHEYMSCPHDIVKPCGECGTGQCKQSSLKHQCTLQYKFPEDVTKDDEHIIDISTAVPYTINDYDWVIIGNREIGQLEYGKDFEVDLSETGTKIKVLSDVKKDACWDIFIYQNEETENDEPEEVIPEDEEE